MVLQRQGTTAVRTAPRRTGDRPGLAGLGYTAGMAPDCRDLTDPAAAATTGGGRDRVDLLLLAILLLGFALRVVYILQSRSSPFFTDPEMDALYHTEWARAIAAGRTFVAGPYFRAPLYPWFLGLCFRLFGENFLVPRLIQAGFGTATVGLTWTIEP